MAANPVNPAPNEFDVKSLELSSRRTGLSFHRTRMSADRTLMSIVRTALALIGFGFTIFQFFRYLRQSADIHQNFSSSTPRMFGMTLVLLGNAILILGIYEHVKFMWGLRKERQVLIERDLVHDDIPFVLSVTLLIASILLMLGIATTFEMILKYRPFA